MQNELILSRLIDALSSHNEKEHAIAHALMSKLGRAYDALIEELEFIQSCGPNPRFQYPFDEQDASDFYNSLFFKYIKLEDLVVGETYMETLNDADDNIESMIIMNKKNIPQEIVVYLVGGYDITGEGKKNLISHATTNSDTLVEYLDSIPIEDYRDEGDKTFFEKYGFYDEGLIFYNNFSDEYTIDHEIAGEIRFTAIPEKPFPFKNQEEEDQAWFEIRDTLSGNGYSEDTLNRKTDKIFLETYGFETGEHGYQIDERIQQ